MPPSQVFAVKRNIPRSEAQARLGIGNTKFHELVKLGKIPVSHIGRRTFVRSDILDGLIDHPERLEAAGSHTEEPAR